MKTNLLSIFLLFLIFSSCQIESRPYLESDYEITNQKILNLKDCIAQFGQVESRQIGLGGDLSKQYANYERLLKISSNEDLIQLTKDSSSTVIVYAITGLITRKDKRFLHAFDYYLKNDLNVSMQQGCVGYETTVSEEIYNTYFYKLWNSSEYDKKVMEEDLLLISLDSIILNYENASWGTYKRALKNRDYGTKYHKTVLKIGFEEKDFDALAYLFKIDRKKYQKRIVPFLKKYLTEQEEITVSNLDVIYKVLISLNDDDLNKLLFSKLKDIEQMHDKGAKYRYKNLLYKHGVTKDILSSS